MYANPAYQLTRALEQLEARKIIISDNITAAAKVFDKVVASTPEEPPVTALRDAVLAGADPTAVGAALLYQMGANQLSSAWQQAATEAAYRALAVIMDERETLHAQLKAQADELIEKLGRLATIDVPLDTLIREGKTDDARLLADKELTSGELHALYELRDVALIPGTVRSARAGQRQLSLRTALTFVKSSAWIVLGRPRTAPLPLVPFLAPFTPAWVGWSSARVESAAGGGSQAPRALSQKHALTWGWPGCPTIGRPAPRGFSADKREAREPHRRK
jgi:hypothetical protein